MGLDVYSALAVDRLNGVFDDSEKGLLHFQLIEFGGEEPAFQLERPGDGLGSRIFLKELDAALEEGIEIASGLTALVFAVVAEGAEVIGDFGGFGGSFFDFDERIARGIFGFHAAEHQRGVTEDAGERIVEIERDGAGELKSAIEFLFLDKRAVGDRGGDSFGKQLHYKEFLAVSGEGADGGEVGDGISTFGAEFKRNGRGGRTFPMAEKLVWFEVVFGRPNGGELREVSFESRAEDSDGRLIGTTNRALRI